MNPPSASVINWEKGLWSHERGLKWTPHPNTVSPAPSCHPVFDGPVTYPENSRPARDLQGPSPSGIAAVCAVPVSAPRPLSLCRRRAVIVKTNACAHVLSSVRLLSVYFREPATEAERVRGKCPLPKSLHTCPCTLPSCPHMCAHTRRSHTLVNRGQVQALIFKRTLQGPQGQTITCECSDGIQCGHCATRLQYRPTVVGQVQGEGPAVSSGRGGASPPCPHASVVPGVVPGPGGQGLWNETR